MFLRYVEQQNLAEVELRKSGFDSEATRLAFQKANQRKRDFLEVLNSFDSLFGAAQED